MNIVNLMICAINEDEEIRIRLQKLADVATNRSRIEPGAALSSWFTDVLSNCEVKNKIAANFPLNEMGTKSISQQERILKLILELVLQNMKKEDWEKVAKNLMSRSSAKVKQK